MKAAGHELLARAGLAQDEHRGVGGADQADVVAQLAHRARARPPLSVPEYRPDLLRQVATSPCSLARACSELADLIGIADRDRGQRGEQLEQLGVDLVEAIFVVGVRGDEADGRAVEAHGGGHAGVQVIQPAQCQPVEGIRLVRIGEAHGVARCQRPIEARALAAGEAQGLRVSVAPETAARHHAQPVTVEQHDRSRVEGHQPLELAEDGVEHGVAIVARGQLDGGADEGAGGHLRHAVIMTSDVKTTTTSQSF